MSYVFDDRVVDGRVPDAPHEQNSRVTNALYPKGASRRSPRRRSGGLLAVAVAGVTGAAVLLVVASRHQSPRFVARAQAPLVLRAEKVLHQRTQTIVTSASGTRRVGGHDEIWIDTRPPHRFRYVWRDPTRSFGPPVEMVLGVGTVVEMGGALDHPSQQLQLTTPKLLEDHSGAVTERAPIRDLPQEIAAGKVPRAGTTTLNGRTVERIRIASPIRSRPQDAAYAYVDPTTLYPVEISGPGIYGPGGAVQGSFSRLPEGFKRVHVVTRYLTWEYLPATAGNLKLTNIEAMHPRALVCRIPAGQLTYVCTKQL